MSYQIIRQPDDRYAIFDTNTDTIIIWDATAGEIEGWFVEKAIDDTRRDIRATIERIDAGRVHRGAMTWQDALAKDRQHGGDASMEIEGQL